MSGDTPSRLPTLNRADGFTEQFGGFPNATQAIEEVYSVFHDGSVYDNIAHLSTRNSHRLFAGYPQCVRVESVPDQLKALRARAQPKLSVRKIAEELGVPASTYAAYEDPKKFKKAIIPFDLAKKLATIFELRGIEKKDVLALAGLTGELEATIVEKPRATEEGEWLTVKGSVAAGVWREQSQWTESEQYSVRFGPSPFNLEHRFAVRMDGLSMNRTIQPGADLECLFVKFSPIPPRAGDLVIAERRNHDLVELTCKRLAMDGDEYVLLCESYEPEFQEPIRIGKPDADDFTDNEIAIVGIVLSAKLDLAPRDLSERRYRR